jgi:hypothetical protein
MEITLLVMHMVPIMEGWPMQGTLALMVAMRMGVVRHMISACTSMILTMRGTIIRMGTIMGHMGMQQVAVQLHLRLPLSNQE